MESIPVSNFNLHHTLSCGQFFRYTEVGSWYYVHVGKSLFRIKQTCDAQNKSVLLFKGCKKEVVERVFCLDENYEDILSDLDKDTALRQLIPSCAGLRIMRQDPWECLISFVCSSASNIPRITKNVHDLARFFGIQQTLGSYVSWQFPRQRSIVEGKMLRDCKLGYREKFVLQISQTITDSWLRRLAKKEYSAAKSELIELPGVGSKIADCVLLFSFGFSGAFPVDVWIKRGMQELYPSCKIMNERSIAEFGRSHFGKNAGYAQQFVYHWRRNSDR